MIGLEAQGEVQASPQSGVALARQAENQVQAESDARLVEKADLAAEKVLVQAPADAFQHSGIGALQSDLQRTGDSREAPGQVPISSSALTSNFQRISPPVSRMRSRVFAALLRSALKVGSSTKTWDTPERTKSSSSASIRSIGRGRKPAAPFDS